MNPQFSLRGGTAVVTGAGSGIGRATARALLERGCKIIVADIDGDSAAAVAEEVGGESHAVDVADRTQMEGLAKAVLDAHGPPDVLVNNAGVGMTGRFLDMTPEDWDWILGINLHGVIHGCTVFGPSMVKRGRGHVVNLSSGLGFSPRATEPAYVTTKAAVLALSQCLRADWGPSGVGVSAICPGVIRTPIVGATRYLGGRADAKVVDGVAKIFSKGHPPELVAKSIVSAIERNRPVVPVGVESYIGWVAHRILPTRLVDHMARASLGGV